MPRSKTRARLRTAQSSVRDSTDPMDDDSGRTPARMDYLRREIGRKLRMVAANRTAREGRALSEASRDVPDQNPSLEAVFPDEGRDPG